MFHPNKFYLALLEAGYRLPVGSPTGYSTEQDAINHALALMDADADKDKEELYVVMCPTCLIHGKDVIRLEETAD